MQDQQELFPPPVMTDAQRLDNQAKTIRIMRERIIELQAALEFYADPANWQPNEDNELDLHGLPISNIVADRGEHARAALAGEGVGE